MDDGRAFDLLVVGGGPAGLATAIEARLAGLETLVIDQRGPAIDAACGEGLMPIGVERLGRLGVEIPDPERAAFRGIRYFDGDLVAEARFREGFGLGIRRTTLHAALRRRAAEVGAELRWGERIKGLAPGGVESGTGRYRARWIAAADGRQSMVRKWSGLEGRTPTPLRYGVRRHYALAPWSEFVEVYWADNAEAYVTPIGPDSVGVAFLSSELPVRFDRLLSRFPALRARLDRAEAISRDRGAGPFGQRPKAVVRDRLALIGDASGSLDPITGEGLSIAFAQAHELIRSLELGRIERYSQAHRRIIRVPRSLTDLLLTLERHVFLRRGMMRAFTSHPSLFAHLVNGVATGQSLHGARLARALRPMTRIERSRS